MAQCSSSQDTALLHHHPVMAKDAGPPSSHSCIHDKISVQRRYSISPQVYEDNRKGRALLALSDDADTRQPIRIYLNYDAVGLSPDRDCRTSGQIVKVRMTSYLCRMPSGYDFVFCLS